MDSKTVGERRLIELIEVGLSIPIEPDDPAFWQKRREALRRTIDEKRVPAAGARNAKIGVGGPTRVPTALRAAGRRQGYLGWWHHQVAR